MHVIAFVLGALALPSGCGGSSSATPPKTSKDDAARARHAANLVGRWGPTLPPEEAHAVFTLRCALADPPDEETFERQRPTDADRSTFQAVVQLRSMSPDAPRLEEMRQRLADYEASIIEITPTAIRWQAPSPASRYRVVSAHGETVTVAVEGDDATVDVRFLDRDHIEMRGSKHTFLLTRDVVPKSGSAPRNDTLEAGAPPDRGAWDLAMARPL